MYLRNINQESIAKIVNAITPRSVLLSTNTKKAPIQLVNQNNNIIRPLYIPIVVVISSSSVFFGAKYVIASLMSPVPKISTNIPLRKFIATATVSGAIQNQLLIGWISAKKNIINICRSHGIIVADHHTSPHITP